MFGSESPFFRLGESDPRLSHAPHQFGDTDTNALGKHLQHRQPDVLLVSTTRDEGGHRDCRGASGSAAELTNLHVGYVINPWTARPSAARWNRQTYRIARQVR